MASSQEQSNLPGFEEAAGDVWIYPTNNPIRDYQFSIVNTALFHNTLVSLPTGLGKTFIAAVVMYNYNRWYPNDVIVFMAPTRPLVTQQLKACHNIGGIHAQDTVELTGKIPPNKRKELWKTKKVFFLTPQVMASDLSKGSCPASKVRCIVVDEAHKAMGNHAYVQVISTVAAQQSPIFFRVLALSATPGSDIFAVQQVFKNLMISRVELRSEDSSDILPYTHQNCVEKIVVGLSDDLKSCRDSLLEVFQLYTGKLMKRNVISGRSGSSFVQFQLINLRDKYRTNPPPGIAVHEKGYIEADFATSISLAKALELLEMHGLCSCYTFMKGIFDKERGNATVAAEFRRNDNIKTLLKFMQEKLNISNGNSSLSTSALFTTFANSNLNGSSHAVSEGRKEIDYLSSHPKMGILKDIVVKHFEGFSTEGESTRIMIFSQYRDNVEEIGAMLDTLRPLVKPMTFVGQSKSGGGKAGLNQKNQAVVLQDFRSGGYNVLVATSVGEEGLDIGEVDLIICYDSCGSPTRLIQRMGRTGRKRQGKTIFLLTEGKEEAKYQRSNSMHKSISKNISDTSKFEPYLFKDSPRMIPVGIEPVCFKMRIVLSSERADYNKESKKQTTEATKSSKTTKSLKLSTKFSGTNAKLNPPLNFPKVSEIETNECAVPTLKPNEDDYEMEAENFCAEVNNHNHGEDDVFLRNMFSIDDSNQNYEPCLYIMDPNDLTKSLQTLSLSGEAMEMPNVVHTGHSVRLFREEVETMVLVGSKDGKCPCGNGNTHLPGECFSSSLGSQNTDEKFRRPQQDINIHQSRSEINNTSISKSFHFETKSNLEADIALLFDDDDPFGDGDDNWMQDIDEPEVTTDLLPYLSSNYIAGPSRPYQQEIIQGQGERIEVSYQKPQKTVESLGEGEIKDKRIEVDSEAEMNKDQVRYTRQQMHELFDDDEILFEEEDDYTDSDGEDKNDSHKNKGSNLSSTSNDALEHPVRQADDSKTASVDMFNEINISPINNDTSSEFFECKPERQSTPKKLDFEMTEEVNDFFETTDNSPSSPDLSQFRLENQIRNPKVSHHLFKKYEDIMSPDNNSADMLNGLLNSMRMKNSKRDNIHNKGSSCEYPFCKSNLTSSTHNDSRPNDQSVMNSTVEDLKPKKKFVFKKKPCGITQELINATNLVSQDSTTFNQSNYLFANKNGTNKLLGTCSQRGICSSRPPGVASSTVINPPKSTTSRNMSWPIKIEKPPSPVGIPEVIDRSRHCDRHCDSKKVESASNDKSLREDVRQYQLQYCSEDMMDSDFNNQSWMTSEKNLQKNTDEEKINIKDIIEKKRLQAIEIRNRKRQADEQLLLQEIKPINFEVPKSRIPHEFKGPAVEQPKVQTVSPCLSNTKRNRENVPHSSGISTDWNRGFKRKLDQPEFSDDDDFDFVKPQRKAPSSKVKNEVTCPVSPCENKDVSSKKKFKFTRTPKRAQDSESLPRSVIPIKSPSSTLASILEDSDEEDDFSNNKEFRRNRNRPNPFLDFEAEVSGDSSDGWGDEISVDNQDDFDESFVTQNFDETVTHSQHARYVESIKDVVPIQVGGNKKPLSPKVCGGLENRDYDESYYEGDSFCVPNDEVEYSDVGTFTQAMQKAKNDIEKEVDGGRKRVTRKGRKQQLEEGYKRSPKRRRRVVVMEDSSEED